MHLGVREGSEVVYIAKIGGHQQAASPSRLGGRMPLQATPSAKRSWPTHRSRSATTCWPGSPPFRAADHHGTGNPARATRHHLDKGVAFEYEESAVGIVCVAAPVLGRDDVALAAVSVTGPVTRFEPRRPHRPFTLRQPGYPPPSPAGRAADVRNLLGRRTRTTPSSLDRRTKTSELPRQNAVPNTGTARGSGGAGDRAFTCDDPNDDAR